MLPATTRWLARGLSHRKLRLARMRPTESRSALFGIVAGIFVSGTGIGSLLPILPLYLRERGASYALVGVIVGSALLAQAIRQWPAGILAERVCAAAMMVGCLVVAAAAAVIAVTLRTSSRVRVDNVPRLAVSGPSRAKAAVIAVAILSIGLGLLIGVYDVIWSLYMRSRGASDPVVGLSFTLFALPLLVATPLAGWSSDRWDRRWLAVGSVVLGSLMGPIYPYLTSIPTILFVGLFEGALWAFTTPSMNSFLMDAVADRRAEAQGIVGTALSSATAVGSLVGGALFALGVAIPFLVAAGAGIVFALAALPWMLSAGARRPVPEGESA